MSYNKNTVVISDIDNMVKLLTELGVEFNVELLGTVNGNGLNDSYDQEYEIRKLTYKNVAVLEQMRRSHDCDSDDVLVGELFDADKVPKEWPLEVYLDEDEFVNPDDYEQF